MRTCVVCRRRSATDALVRIRAGAQVGPGPGRGAWLCRGPACVAARGAAGALARSLRSSVSDADLDALRGHEPFL